MSIKRRKWMDKSITICPSCRPRAPGCFHGFVLQILGFQASLVHDYEISLCWPRRIVLRWATQIDPIRPDDRFIAIGSWL